MGGSPTIAAKIAKARQAPAMPTADARPTPPALPKAEEITVRLNGQNGFGVDVDVVGMRIVITGVAAGGSAAAGDLRAGDELLALAGVDVADQVG